VIVFPVPIDLIEQLIQLRERAQPAPAPPAART
jgi:hypothetical protein